MHILRTSRVRCNPGSELDADFLDATLALLAADAAVMEALFDAEATADELPALLASDPLADSPAI